MARTLHARFAATVLASALLTGCVREDARDIDVAAQPAVAPTASSLELMIEGRPQRVRLQVERPDLVLVIDDPMKADVSRTLVAPALAIGMLADRRLAPFWPMLDRWGGPGLNTQRDRAIEELPVGDLAAYSGAVLTQPGRQQSNMQSTLQTVYSLRMLGRFDDAHRLIEIMMTQWSDMRPTDIETLMIAKSDLYKTAGRKSDAILLLERHIASVPAEHARRALAPLAELQAEEGRFAAAINTLDTPRARLGLQVDDDPIPGTEWVRACALSGLTQDLRAKAKIAASAKARWEQAVTHGEDATAGEGGGYLAPDYYRFALCTGNGEALADYLAYDARQTRIPSAAGWLFQPHHRPLDTDHAAAIERASRDHRLTDLLASIRPLDASYAAAINGWRYASDVASE